MKNKVHMKKIILGLASLTLLVACKSGQKTYTAAEITAESKKANAFFEKAFNEQISRSPMSMTYVGMKKDNDKWDDLSDAHALEGLELSKRQLKEMETTIDYNALDYQSKLSYDLLKKRVADEVSDWKYRLHNYPVNQMFGLHSQVPAFMINMHQVSDVKDAEAYIKRIQGIKPMFAQLIDGLKVRETKGIIAPKFVFPRVIDDSQNILKGRPFSGKVDHTLLADFKTKIGKINLDQKTKDRMVKELENALLSSLKPAYESLISFLTEQEQRANTDAGVWKFPNGSAFYNNALERTTTTKMTSDEIHQLGKKEVARIHNEMRAIMKKVKFEGSLQEFFKYMQEDQQFYYPNDAQGKADYLAKATDLINNMKGRLDELFYTKPKADLIVKKVEAFREKSAGTAFYNSPALDGSRPGIYYANLYNMKNMPKYQMEALAYHEGIPGHHMQLAIAQELKGIPKFRKLGGYTAYVEGWGLYCELVPKEMGLYEDPYSDFGRLAMELWRACRLVADTGIHGKQKWSREQAIKYYKDNTPDTERDCIRMVERHIVMPSQATAYKIGMLKILSLREKTKKSLEKKFDIKAFHDIILKSGALPLDMLEKNVDTYIEKTK